MSGGVTSHYNAPQKLVANFVPTTSLQRHRLGTLSRVVRLGDFAGASAAASSKVHTCTVFMAVENLSGSWSAQVPERLPAMGSRLDYPGG